jgi:lipid-binding SYLF domain-containing protein
VLIAGLELFVPCCVVTAAAPKGAFKKGHLMINSLTKLASATALAALAFTLPAQADNDKGEVLRDANRTVNHLRTDPAFGTARTMLQGAEAIYIVPKLIKGGFIFGAEGGEGVLLHRTGHGWSTPRFYDMGSASFGLQIGLEKAELVFIINSKRALRGIEKGELKLGAGAGITVVTLSSAAEGATTTHGGDMVVWASGTGAYGGLTFNGTVIKQDKDENEVPATGPEAQALRKNLASIW